MSTEQAVGREQRADSVSRQLEESRQCEQAVGRDQRAYSVSRWLEES
jgi:hypothetical protein